MNEVNNNENLNQVAPTPVAPVTPAPVPVESTPTPAPVESAPVAAPVQPVQETVASPQPVAPVQESAAPAPVSETPAPVATTTEPEKTESAPSSEATPSGNGTEGKLRFPLVVVLLLSIVIIFLFVYYFVLITPKNLFAKAMKAQINGMTSGLFTSESTYKTANYFIDSNFTSSNDSAVSFLNGLEYKFNLSHDVEKGNFGVDLVSNIDTLETNDRIEHNRSINSSFYYFDRAILVKVSDAILKTDTHGDSADNTEEFLNLINEAAYEAIDLVDVSKVKRTIETKKIKDQSLLAIRFNTKFDNAELNRIWQSAIDNLLDTSKHPEFVKSFAVNLDITEEQAIDTLKNFKNKKINIKDIELNYYLNLACNNLVAFELTIDGTSYMMSQLSGYYFFDIDTDGVDIDMSFNTKTSDFEGTLVLDNESTYSAVDFKSITNLNENYEKLGNEINFDFYGEKTKGSSKKASVPYLSVNAKITYEFDKEVNFFDSSKVVPFEQASMEDLEKLSYIVNKLEYELLYFVGLNTVNRTEMTPRMFAEGIMNSMGDSIIGSGVPVEIPESNVPMGDVNAPVTNETVDNNANNIVENKNIATKSE